MSGAVRDSLDSIVRGSLKYGEVRIRLLDARDALHRSQETMIELGVDISSARAAIIHIEAQIKTMDDALASGGLWRNQ